MSEFQDEGGLPEASVDAEGNSAPSAEEQAASKIVTEWQREPNNIPAGIDFRARMKIDIFLGEGQKEPSSIPAGIEFRSRMKIKTYQRESKYRF